MTRCAVCGLMAAFILTCALALPASAEDNYIFGTSLVFTSPASITPKNGYWGDLLPKKYNFSQGSIVDAINAARAARGNKTEVDIALYPIVIGSETQKGNTWEYNIDFLQMLPEDVEVALKKFPMTGKLAELKHSYRPVSIGYFSGTSADGGESVLVNVLGQSLNFNKDNSFSQIYDAVARALVPRLGADVKFDLSVNHYRTVTTGGTGSFDIYVTVYLNGAENSIVSGEGGE
jgi:hypothetical protein